MVTEAAGLNSQTSEAGTAGHISGLVFVKVLMMERLQNIEQVFCVCGTGVPFGQANVQEWLSCSKSKATNVMNAMKAAKVIKKVTGYGSGRYEFIEL